MRNSYKIIWRNNRMKYRIALGLRRVWAYIWKHHGLLSSYQSILIEEMTHCLAEMTCEMWLIKRDIGKLEYADEPDVEHIDALKTYLKKLEKMKESMEYNVKEIVSDSHDLSQFSLSKLKNMRLLIRLR